MPDSVSRKSLLRHLRPSQLRPVISSLNVREKYKIFGSEITKKNGECLLSPVELDVLSSAHGNPTETIIRTWTYDNPTIEDLLEVLEKAKLLQERNLVLSQLLHESVSRQPVESDTSEYGGNLDSSDLPLPGQKEYVEESGSPGGRDGSVTVPKYLSSYYAKDTTRPVGRSSTHQHTTLPQESDQLIHVKDLELNLNECLEEECDNVEDPDKRSENVFCYHDIQQATDNFNVSGRKLGKGGFGHVFYGEIPGYPALAVKRLDVKAHKQGSQEKQFRTELNTLTRVKHPNVLRLFGYSVDGPSWCLVYEYMPNGALDERLKCQLRLVSCAPLSVQQRIHILHGSAAGLCYIHKHHLIHRDVKSANILLDTNFNAKVGDCGLVRSGPQEIDETHETTSVIIGTRGYMPMEYMRYGHVSEKMDSYAFGVILIEVLTSLPSYSSKSKRFLFDVMTREYKERKDFLEVVDNQGQWPLWILEQGHDLILQLLLDDKNERPSLQDCLATIAAWEVQFHNHD